MANVHVNLLFEAKTQNAINNINQLGQLLNQISNKTTIGVESGSLNQAAQAARELQMHLGNAVNVNTGKLDLTKLNTSLKQSNQSLSQLSGQLVAAGTTGQQAFVKLANSIASAQVPAFTLGKTIGGLMKTMGTAAMWTVAYGAVDAITGAFKGAIDYAKDLNKALTDIAIVSDLTEKQLADFAKTASKAAKELKTTTTAYAEAALIFYQQGLSGKEVEERANAVIKMAQVTGQTAQTVSDQMTAVWNNFDNGSKSLEYYIDVLTALGAATASSTDEITQGLEKFAAIANTVGLSYEYAATALATVTAQTRQSADVVGTAFKTLFARIQDLELGETLEDGVTLGSYSQALAKIGVSALDANGNLREMDDILDDMGAKWDTLTEAQKTATAQSVAGVRQYTQLIALMDNWDTFQINLEIAEDAEGTLEKQHDTWAKSAEAAAQRVKEAWNQVYSQILDDDTVIGFTNAFADLIGTIGKAIDSMGGLGPMLLMLVSIFSKQLTPYIINFADKGVQAFNALTGATQKQVQAEKQEFQSQMQLMISNGLIEESYIAQLNISNDLINQKSRLEKIGKSLTQTQFEQAKSHMAIVESLGLQNQEQLKTLDLTKKQIQASEQNIKANHSFELINTSRAYSQESGRPMKNLNTYSRDKNKTIIGRATVDVSRDISLKDAEYTDLERSIYTQAKGQLDIRRIRTGAVSKNADTASMDISIENIKKITNEYIKYSNAIEDTATEIQNLTSLEKQVGAGTIHLSDNTFAESQKLSQNVQNAQTQLATANESGNIQEQVAARQALNQALQEQEKFYNSLSDDQLQAIKTILQEEQALKKLGQSLNLSEEELKEFDLNGKNVSQALATLKSGFTQLGKGSELSASQMRILIDEMLQAPNISDSLRQALQGVVTALEQKNQAERNAVAGSKAYEQALEQLRNKLNTTKLTLTDTITAISRFAGQASMMVSGISMLSNLDFKEDALQSTMTLLMAISMLLPTVTGLLKGLSAVTQVFNAVQSQGNILQQIRYMGMQKEAVAQALVTKGIDIDTAARWANVAAQMAQYWYISLIIIALAAVVGIIYAFVKASKAEKEAVENANKNLENQKKLLDDIKNSYEELKNSIEDYAEAQNAINKLVEGSQAWKEAIAEANEQVVQLLTMYPKLAQYMSSENGRLIISDEGLQVILDEQWKEVQLAQKRALEAQVVRDIAQRNLDLKNAFDGKLTTYYEELQSGEINNTMGGIHGDDAADTANIANAVINGTDIETNTNANKQYKTITTTYREIFDKLKPYYDTGNYEEYVAQLQQLTNSNGEVMSAIHDQMVLDAELRDATKELTEQMLIASWNDSEKFKNAKHKDFVTEVSASKASVYGDAKSAREQLIKWANAGDESAAVFASALGGFVGDGYKGAISDEKAFEQYLKVVLGEESVTVGDNEVIGENYKIEGMYGTKQTVYKKNKDGDWDVYNENLSNDQATIDMANALATDKLEENIAVLDTKAGQYVEAFTSAVDKREGESDGAFQSRMLDMAADFETGKGIDVSKLTPEEVSALREGIEAGVFSGIEANAVTGEGFADVLKTSLDQYDAQVTSNNLQASADWLENKEQRDADTLNNILSESGMDANDFEQYVKQFEAYGDAAEDVAKQTLKLSNATLKLSNIFDENEEVFDKSSKTFDKNSGAYITAVNDVRESLTDMLGVDLGYDYVEENLESIKKAAEGDIEALDKLQLKAASSKVDAMIYLDEEQKSILQDYITQLENTDISLRPQIDTTDFVESCNQMIQSGKVSMEELQSYFDSVGFYPKYDGYQEVPGPKTISHITGTMLGQEVDTTITSEQTLKVPKITGGTYKAPSTTSIPAGKNKTKTKGGGSKKDKKDLKDEIERYHEITAELEDLERQLDAIAEAKDRAFGPDKLAYMDQEIAKQRELADAQKRYLSEIEANFKSDASYMLGYGAVLDEEGRIANYDELMKSKIDAYNSGKMSEEAYEQFVKDLEQYEETLGLLKDEQQEFINLQNTIIDLGLEKVQYEVEFKVSIEEDSLTLIEFMMENLTDSIADAADAIGYFGQQADSAFKNMDTYAKGVRDVFSVENANGEAQFSEEQINALLSNDPDAIAVALEGEILTEAQIEALREYRDAMMDEYKNAQEASIGIIETLGSAFEDAQKPFADAAEEMEHLTSVTQAYVDVIELVGAERLGIDKKLLTAAAKTQTALAQQQLTNSKNQLEQSKQMLADYRVAYEQALASGDAKVIEAAKEQLESMEATAKENEQAMLDDLSTALEAAASEFEKAMEEIASSFENAMTGAYGSFAALEASFEQQKALADRYLDDYQKIYELSKLNRDIINSIDDNDSIRAKERLRDIQEEINKLQESNVEMTQYEVDELRAKYELRLAEIALEEAQNAKSQVRMARDSEGNWSYVYTADEEAVGTAEQNYEDKLYAYQELAQNRTDELLEQMISIPREFSEAVQEIYQDQTLNDEERRLRIKETEDYYQEMYNFVVAQMRVVNADAAELYAQDWKRYSEMTGYKISLDSNWVDSFEETIVAQLTGYSSLAEAEQGFLSSSQQMLVSLSGAYATYQETAKATLDLALGDLEDFLGDESTEGSLAYYLAQAKEKAKEVADEAASIGTAHAEAFEKATEAAKEKLGDYQAQMTNWKTENGKLIESINQVISAYANTKSAQDGIAGIEGALDGVRSMLRKVESAANAASNAMSKLGGYSAQPVTLPASVRVYHDSRGQSLAFTLTKGEEFENLKIVKTDVGYYLFGNYQGKNSFGGYISGDDARELIEKGIETTKHFDTGGYTGSWGSSGRLAMLHQKELVLNAEDTVNFLDAVNIVREIAQAIDLSAVAQAMQMGNLQAAQATSTAQTLEQQVSIHAEFPNATNHSEIEEAFRNLTLTASQFANRKN